MSVKVYIGEKFVGVMRALCDTGSQPNLVMHRIIKNYFNQTSIIQHTILGIGNEPIQAKHKISLKIKPWFESENEIIAEFLVLPTTNKWCPMLPPSDVQCVQFPNNAITNLADPLFWKSGPITMVFGVGIWIQLVQGGLSKINDNVVGQTTKFGEILLGQLEVKHPVQVADEFSVHAIGSDELQKSIEKFWKFEDIDLCGKKDAEQELCEAIFKNQHYRDASGRFVVAIPLKTNIVEIGSSRQIALKRFLMLEKRFQRDEEFHKQYIEFMREFEELDHMTQVQYNESFKEEMVYYIPHHGVVSSGRFRVVFDASCKTNKNMSLNEIQLIGEKLQRDLHEITMRFRRFPIAISADIQKMYRQVKILPKQWNLQRIFWRKDPGDPIGEYCITRVIYGMASAPHCAVRAMVEGANMLSTEYPEAVYAIKNDFYVDDGLTGAKTIPDAIKLAKEMQFVLQKSGFPLCKWKSNCKILVNELKGDNEPSIKLGEDDQTSVLGLKWLIKSDEFTYDINENHINNKITKRIVLSKIAQLYDPNGFVAPFITKAKIFMQILWKLKIDWDLDLPSNLALEWNAIWKNIESIRKVRIPRYIG